MAVTSEHLAYEIDAAARVATVVYIGELGDNEVLGFYASLMAHYPDAPNYDYLLDMRYTDWRATPETIDRLDQLFRRRPSDYLRRIAIVRKGLESTNMRQAQALRQGLNNRTIRYFADMEQAQHWLRSAP
ncbi:hypothetical protein [Ferrovibrio sp.]|uniref:hypothetical protein n=1 Tax=Ferrovibrio sp. TaxID=1917215 RepID=UPI000CADD1A0|nr:hypothetical protein [Ferrovibrio sp.]PJI43894.1 MAG: hypothetical protein CTR53_02495 [Ferrovibrio sp.]